MKYEDFWSIYFTILGILLIFYLTHNCICLFNCHHPSYLSETASLHQCFSFLFWTIVVQMVLLVRHLTCLAIESGFWFIESGVSIQLNWLSTRILPVSASYQIVLSASWFLQGSHPCWLLFILLVHSSYSSCCRPKPVARSLVIAIGSVVFSSVVIGEWSDWLFATVIATVCRGSLMVADPCWWWILDGGFPDDMKFDEGWW